MISTVVETPVDALASNAHERPYAPSIRSTALMPPPPTPQLSNEQRLAVQLIHLASQFHASAYSRAKFGARGAALTYIPMSLHVPDHFKQLQDRQALSAQEKAWWISDRRFTSEPRAATDERVGETMLPSQSSPVVTYGRPSLDIQNEISAAIDAPLAATATTGELPWKTSTSHPINISTIIPHELLSTISLHITLSDRRAPTMFNIHPAFSLDRITMPAIPANIPPPPPIPMEPIPQLPASDSCARDMQPSPVAQFLWNRSSMKHALEAALASDIKSPSDLTNGNLPARTAKNNTPARTPNIGVFSIPRIPPLQLPDCDILDDVLATADDSTIGLPPSVLGKHERSYTAPPAVFKALIAEAMNVKRRPQNNGLPALADSSSRTQFHLNVTVGADGLSPSPRTTQFSGQLRVSSFQPREDAHAPPSSTPPILGNLFLSSCPGKKVRLSGPVHGRGAVCRDLKQDLQRMKSLGVGCIVCCLDNEELAFLGAPWPEYSQAAHELGIDILRLPIPEGLAPMDPAAFDAHLSRLISAYTLSGTPVLVHCRGGVGRAGLVACCWMLKLGLCAWPGSAGAAGVAEGIVRKDTLQLMERVIATVRRRRSLKAIETYEQVKFLAAYVEYLREKAAGA